MFSTGTSSGQSGSNRSSDISEATSGTTHGVTATVRAAKAIAPGEEVLHCYGENMTYTQINVKSSFLPRKSCDYLRFVLGFFGSLGFDFLSTLTPGPHSSRMATVDRTRLLQEQYYFLCRCEACSQQGGGSRQARQQQSHVEGSQPKSGLLCSRCRGPLRVRVFNFVCFSQVLLCVDVLNHGDVLSLTDGVDTRSEQLQTSMQ